MDGSPVAEAESWVAFIDAEDYAASWSAAGQIFQRSIATDDWSRAVVGAREPFGSMVSRTFLDETRSTTLPGVPDGDYAVIRFATAFARKKAAVETIVLTHEPSGWKVDGYFVR